MAKFLIEVPHEETTEACVRMIDVFLRTGSHFLTHADWGCQDGEHKAWIVVEVDTKQEALGIVPPPYRANAKIVQLNSFSMQDIAEFLPHD